MVTTFNIYPNCNVKLAINGGIAFGSKLNAEQLVVIAEYMNDGDELELTIFQQLYIEVLERKVELVQEQFEAVGLACYPVGNFVKSLRTCSFCKGSEQEGMPGQVQPEQLYEAVDKVIAIYAEHGKKSEGFFKFVNRYGVEN